MTRVWAITGSIGVPVGTHVDELISVTTGAPPARTRVAPIRNCPVTHGGTVVPVSAQAAIAYGLVRVTSGWAVSVTRGNGASGVA